MRDREPVVRAGLDHAGRVFGSRCPTMHDELGHQMLGRGVDASVGIEWEPLHETGQHLGRGRVASEIAGEDSGRTGEQIVELCTVVRLDASLGLDQRRDRRCTLAVQRHAPGHSEQGNGAKRVGAQCIDHRQRLGVERLGRVERVLVLGMVGARERQIDRLGRRGVGDASAGMPRCPGRVGSAVFGQVTGHDAVNPSSTDRRCVGVDRGSQQLVGEGQQAPVGGAEDASTLCGLDLGERRVVDLGEHPTKELGGETWAEYRGDFQRTASFVRELARHSAKVYDEIGRDFDRVGVEARLESPRPEQRSGEQRMAAGLFEQQSSDSSGFPWVDLQTLRRQFDQRVERERTEVDRAGHRSERVELFVVEVVGPAGQQQRQPIGGSVESAGQGDRGRVA